MHIDSKYIKKFVVMFAAILVMGFALSFLIEVNWGLDPASFGNKSISKFIGLSLGTWQVIEYAVMLVAVIALTGREMIGAGTVANMFCIGYTADFCCFLWERFIPRAVFTDSAFLPLKAGIFVLAMAVFVTSASVYMNADMGVAPYDAIPMIISRHVHFVPFTVVRICFDMLMVAMGVLFCARRNPYLLRSLPGALVMAVLLGPTITAVGKFMSGLQAKKA